MVETLHRRRGGKLAQDKRRPAAGQLEMGDLVVAICAIAFTLLQVDVIQAGAGLEQGIVKQESFEMQDSQPLPALDRYAIKLDGIGMLSGQRLVE